jgi:hypothetical protein
MAPRSTASRHVQDGVRRMSTWYTFPVDPRTTNRWCGGGALPCDADDDDGIPDKMVHSTRKSFSLRALAMRCILSCVAFRSFDPRFSSSFPSPAPFSFAFFALPLLFPTPGVRFFLVVFAGFPDDDDDDDDDIEEVGTAEDFGRCPALMAARTCR